MEISNQKNLQKSPYFKSTPICRVNVKNAKTGELIPAVFSKLNQKDPFDIDTVALEKINASWKSPEAACICTAFPKNYDNRNYYCIELPGKKSLSRRIIALAETDTDTWTKTMDMRYIAVRPSLSKEGEIRRKRPIKSIGEVFFGMIINQAKKQNANCLYFYSVNNDFYEKVLEKTKIYAANCHLDNDQDDFWIRNNYFDKYLDYISNKYKIDFSA